MMDSLPNTNRTNETILAGALTRNPSETSSPNDASASMATLFQYLLHNSPHLYNAAAGTADPSRSIYSATGSFPSKNVFGDSSALSAYPLGMPVASHYDFSPRIRQDASPLHLSSISGSRSGGSSHDAKRSSTSHKSSSSKSNRSPSRSTHHSSQISDNGCSSSSNAVCSSSGGASSSSSGVGGCSNTLMYPTSAASHSRTSAAAHFSRSTTSVTSSTSKSSRSTASSSNTAPSAVSTTANSFSTWHPSASDVNYDLRPMAKFPPDLHNIYAAYSNIYTSNAEYKNLLANSLDVTRASVEMKAFQSLLNKKPAASSSTAQDLPFRVSPPKAKPSTSVSTKEIKHETVNPTLPSVASVLSLANATTAGSFSDKKPKQSASPMASLKTPEKVHHISNKSLIAESLVSYAKEMHGQQSTKDIILACEDKVRVAVHSSMLMAFSSSYIEMFEISSSYGQCVIMLTDTKSKDVSDLVNALYTGKLPSDCSLTGVNYVAQLLGLKCFVSLLQRSLKDEINQSFLRRHNTENLTKTGYDSQIPITLPILESSPKLYKTSENREASSNQEYPGKNHCQSESSEKRGMKRKSDAFSSKFSEHSQYKVKEPKLENFNAFASDSSPLNLSKSSSILSVTSAGDDISHPTISNATTAIDAVPQANAQAINDLVNSQLFNYAETNAADLKAIDDVYKPSATASAVLPSYSDPNFALYAALCGNDLKGDEGNSAVAWSKASSKTATAKSSKQPSTSTTNATTASSATDLYKIFAVLQSLAPKDQQQWLTSLVGSGTDPSSKAFNEYLACVRAFTLVATASTQSAPDSDFDSFRDSNGALNLSADARDDSKIKKDSAKMDLQEAVATSIQNTWASTVAASSAPAFTSASYASSEATPTIAVTGSYAPYQGFDYKSNGLMTASAISPGIGLADLNKLLQSSSLKQVKKLAGDGDPSVSAALSSEGLGCPSSEDGMDDIIEVLADEDGSLLASYAGGQRRLLYHAGHGRRRKGCGTCENCLRSEDCGGCRYCADKAKFGGQNKLKQVCERKRCLLEVPQGVVQKSKTRCQTCKPCLLTADCDECEKCIHNKGLPPTAKKPMCESRLCEYLEMEDLRARNFTEEPSPYSTESVLTEAQAVALAAAATAAAGGTSNCPSPDDFGYYPGDKKARKMLKKKTKDGKSSSPKVSRARTKYQCNTCWGCITTSPCQFCVYCRDMPKHGGTGKYRQKCVKQLCILHPRLQSNKINVIDPDAPLQCELEIALEPHREDFEAAAVTKVAMVNFLRLHHRQEGGDRERQTAKMCDILARRKQILAESSTGNDMDFKEERGETPDNPEYSSEPCRASGSTTASTPEPSDGGLAAYQSRHLPDLRPILGAAVPTSGTMSTAELTAAYSAFNDVLVATTPITDMNHQLIQMQQLMLQQQCSSLGVTSTITPSVVNTKIDTETLADTGRNDADVDVEQVEAVVDNDVVLATDLSSQKKNSESELPSSIDADVIAVSCPSSAIAPFDPEISTDEPKTACEEQPAASISAPPAASLTHDDDKQNAVVVLDVPADDTKEENDAMEVTESEDKSTKQTSPRRGRGARGKRSTDRGRTSRSRSQRRSPSPGGTVRTRAQSRELPPRRARTRTNSYALDYYDNSESEDVLEELTKGADQPTLEENEPLVKGSSEDDEDTRSAAIQAAVQGVLDHELAEARITEDSQQKQLDRHSPTDEPSNAEDETERWTSKSESSPVSEPMFNDANGNKTDVSSAQSPKLYRLDPQQNVSEVLPLDVSDSAPNAEFGAGKVVPPPVPKLKLRLSNGPSRAVEKVDNFDSNGINS